LKKKNWKQLWEPEGRADDLFLCTAGRKNREYLSERREDRNRLETGKDLAKRKMKGDTCRALSQFNFKGMGKVTGEAEDPRRKNPHRSSIKIAPFPKHVFGVGDERDEQIPSTFERMK